MASISETILRATQLHSHDDHGETLRELLEDRDYTKQQEQEQNTVSLRPRSSSSSSWCRGSRLGLGWRGTTPGRGGDEEWLSLKKMPNASQSPVPQLSSTKDAPATTNACHPPLSLNTSTQLHSFKMVWHSSPWKRREEEDLLGKKREHKTRGETAEWDS